MGTGHLLRVTWLRRHFFAVAALRSVPQAGPWFGLAPVIRLLQQMTINDAEGILTAQRSDGHVQWPNDQLISAQVPTTHSMTLRDLTCFVDS